MTGLPSTELPARLELGPADAADDRERRRREKRERKEKKAERKDRKRKKKKQRLSGELAVAAGGNAIACGGYRNTVADVNWDCKMEGQKFGPWSASEVADIKARIKDWANAHGHSGDVESGNFDFLFGRRQKLGGRGAGLSDAERKAFLEIATGFPNRNPKQIYAYVTRHLDPSNYKGAWTEEEKTTLMNLYEQKGAKWAEIGAAIGRAGGACRDKWRMMRNNPKSGDWSPDEVARLRELVNEYFAQNNAAPGRGAGEGNEHLPLRDNINWKAISSKIGTRSENMCMQKWYRIAPSAEETGQWAKGDDKIMLEGILKQVDADDEHKVAWEGLVPGRTLGQIKNRFRAAKRDVPDHSNVTFDVLLTKMIDKYAPEMTKAEALPAP